MKKILLSLIIFVLAGCATLKTSPKVSIDTDKWYYIDGIKFNYIDSTYDFASKKMRIFGLSNGDTIWNTATSTFTSYEIVRRNDSVILMYQTNNKQAKQF